MEPRATPSQAVRRLAAAQAEVVTREQAIGLGLSRHSLARLIDQQHWQRIDRGVFVAHNGTVAWESLAWAGVLIGGTGARLARTAAGHAHGLVEEAPDPLPVYVPHGNVTRSRLHWHFVQERPGVRSSRTTGSPPRTLIQETVLDLCEQATEKEVEDWVTRAVQRRLTTHEHLRRALARRTRHPHRALLVELVHDVGDGAESPLALRYLRDVERPHGLPAGERQHRDASRSVVRDVAYTAYGVVVELDGRRGHEGEGVFRDMHRDNAALLDQLVTLRYGHADVHGQSCAVAAQVSEVLRRRGWTGQLERCARCPLALEHS